MPHRDHGLTVGAATAINRDLTGGIIVVWRHSLLIAFAFALVLAGCASATPDPAPASTTPLATRALDSAVEQRQVASPTPTVTRSTQAPTMMPSHTAQPTVTTTPSDSSARTYTPSPSASPAPSATYTPDPYAGLTIADLRARRYGDGELEVLETLAATSAFTRTLFRYPSDGLNIYGFMNVPAGTGFFPVVIVLHGYIDPNVYQTLAYTTRYADALAQAGYLVLHPNLRGYPPSDDGPNRFRVGMAVDVLNLIGLVKHWGAREGALAQANPVQVGMMGHSMGGGITLRVLAADDGVRAAVLYGSMSADEATNYEQIKVWSGGERGHGELSTPREDLARISPIYYLKDIKAAVSIHHSDDDATVPPEWSTQLADQLLALDKKVEYFRYVDTPHTFRGDADRLFIERMTDFFTRHLRPPREKD